MARTSDFLKNSLSTAILHFVSLIAGFILPRVLIVAYGSEINGLVTSITQFINYFVLVEAGLASAAVYALYKPLSDNDTDAINGVVSAAKKFYIQSGWIFLALVALLSLTYPLFIRTDALRPVEISVLVLVLGVTGTLDFFTLSKYRVLLTAAQKVSVISSASIVNLLVNLLVTVVLARMGVGIVLLKLVALVGIVARSLILMWYVRVHYPQVRFNEPPNTKALNKRWSALYLQILGVVQQGAPVVLATLFTSLSMVSVYSIYNMIVAGLNGILSIFISGLSSSFGDVIARKQNHVLKQSTEEFEVGYYMMLTWAYACAFALILPFVRIYTARITDVDYVYPMLGVLFVLNGLLYNIKTPQGMLVISAGMFQETRIQTTIQGLIAIVAGALLAKPFGLPGIMIGMCASNTYRDIDLLFFVPKNITFRTIKPTAYRIIRVFICIAIVLTPYMILAPPVNTILQWLLHAVILGIFAAIIIVGANLVFDREIMYSIWRRLSTLVRGVFKK